MNVQMDTKSRKSGWMLRLNVLLVVMLFINLPIVSAIEISGVSVKDLTDNSATIIWETDEAADSFVSYGEEKDKLQTIGDAKKVKSHALQVAGLEAQTKYLYSVESKDKKDDNGGSLHSFTTLEKDTTAPTLDVKLPKFVKGNKLDVKGTAEVGSLVKISVNGKSVFSEKIVKKEFSAIGIVLSDNQVNTIDVTATDPSGNVQSFQEQVFADTKKPVITLDKLPDLATDVKQKISGIVSENSTITILINNNSVFTAEGKSFTKEVQLKEGENKIIVEAVDAAGWKASKQISLQSDTKPPTVKFDVAKGLEYYEGRAESDITGETEPGAKVMLYIYESKINEFRADFENAVEEVTADKDGKFKFEEIRFPPRFNFKKLAPREVPKGLEKVLIPKLSTQAKEQRRSYHIYIIAEDKAGKSGYAKRVAYVNTCFSSNFAFDIEQDVRFQQPLRLDPQLLKEGKESIQAVFNLKYNGQAVQQTSLGSGATTQGYKINSVSFQKACTQSQTSKGDYELGCKLLPTTLRHQPSPDKTSYYVTSPVISSKDFVDSDYSWEDFQKRRLKFPLKVFVNYQERTPQGGWESKTQVSCQDLGYFVDVPIESSDLTPDWLTGPVLTGLNDSIETIEKIKPILQNAILVAGIGCFGSFFVKMGARFHRFFWSNFEPWLTKTQKEEKNKCPAGKDQNKLLMQDTAKSWQKSGLTNVPASPADGKTLDTACPKTAKAWKFESYVDWLYRLTCDRFLCRAVPAGWTENKELDDIKAVREKQLQCAASSQGIPLRKIENCHEILEKNPANARLLVQLKKEKIFECYEHDGTFYYAPADKNIQKYTDQNIWVLKPTDTIGSVGVVPKDDLLVHKPERSERFMVGVDATCKQQCSRKTNYNEKWEETTDGHKISDNKVASCYKETKNGLFGAGGAKVTTDKIRVGYTKDCFVDKNNPGNGLYQCICQKKEKSEGEKSNTDNSLRTAQIPKTTGAAGTVGQQAAAAQKEEWFYRQARVYEESKHTVGTYYPKERYISGRDFWGAFGLDYAWDNFRSDENKQATKVDPHNQLISTFATGCLPGINAKVELLQSVLVGMRNCIVQAKDTGEFDAGLCKSIFTQYFCSLTYKAIAGFSSQCSPVSFSDFFKGPGVDNEGVVAGVSEFFDAGFESIPQAMETSITEIQSDYKNANLESFFSTGAQGFGESLCLAALGYDFPMDFEFIMDTAYSFPSKTSVLMPIASREFSGFNPLTGTASFNYRLGGTILPGCNIRGYKTYLKCIGPEDLGRENIDCTQQNCDCLNAGKNTPFLGERTFPVDKRSAFTPISRNKMFELPIPPQQKVSTHYRYDHAVVEVFLDQGENAEACFDEGFRNGKSSGIFYTPISSSGEQALASCQVHGQSGRYICPEITTAFGTGQAYFEHPFAQCYDKTSDSFVACDTPNIYLASRKDDIIVRPYINKGKDPICLKITDTTKRVNVPIISLPEGLIGPYSPKLKLDTVDSSMLGGGIGTVVRRSDSASGCGPSVITYSDKVTTSKKFDFTLYDGGGGLLTVQVDPAVKVELTGGYTRGGSNKLLLNNNDKLTRKQVNDAIFTIDGFRFKNSAGTAVPGTSPVECKYQTLPAGKSKTKGSSTLRVKMELLQPGPGGSCFNANVLVKKAALGNNQQIVNIRIQAEEQAVQVAKADLHSDFMKGKYGNVRVTAQQVVQLNQANLQDAVAHYYWIAGYIADGKHNWQGQYGNSVGSLLDQFFGRGYQSVVTATPEYQKINAYLCEVDKKSGSNRCGV